MAMNFCNRAMGLGLAALLISSGLAVPHGRAQTATNLKCDGCVRSKNLRGNAVTSSKVKNRSIKPADLHEKAKPGGVQFDHSITGFPLDNSYKSVISIIVNAPGPGFIVVAANWFFSGPANSAGRCNLNTVADTGDGPYVYTAAPDVTLYFDIASMTRTFEVPAGETSFHLNCRNFDTGMLVNNPIMNAMFFPNRY